MFRWFAVSLLTVFCFWHSVISKVLIRPRVAQRPGPVFIVDWKWTRCYWAKAFVWLDRMLHHFRADPTNAMIGVDNIQTRSPWGVQVEQLTKICWHLICSPSTPDFLGQVGLNLSLVLVTSCCSCQTARCRPAYCWLGLGSMSIGDPSKSHWAVSGLINILFKIVLFLEVVFSSSQCRYYKKFLSISCLYWNNNNRNLNNIKSNQQWNEIILLKIPFVFISVYKLQKWKQSSKKCL